MADTRTKQGIEGSIADPIAAEKVIEAVDAVVELAALKVAFNDLLVKLDADAGVTDIDYASTLTVE